MEFEFNYNDVTVQQIDHYSTGTPLGQFLTKNSVMIKQNKTTKTSKKQKKTKQIKSNQIIVIIIIM